MMVEAKENSESQKTQREREKQERDKASRRGRHWSVAAATYVGCRCFTEMDDRGQALRRRSVPDTARGAAASISRGAATGASGSATGAPSPCTIFFHHNL